MHLEKLIECAHLSPKEALTYMTLIEYGPQAASTLAKLVSVNRTTIYDILNQLEKKGLVLTYVEGKTTFYFVDDVRKLLVAQEHSYKETLSLVQDLESRKNREQIGVRYIQGNEGIRSIYDEILRKNTQELLGWMDLDAFYGFFTMDEEKDQIWTDTRKSLGITARLLLQRSPMTEEFQIHDKDNMRETRLIEKEKAPFETTCFIYGDSICLLDPHSKGTGLVISNPRIVTFFRTLFEINWNTNSQ